MQAGIADTLTDRTKIASAKENCSGWTIGQWILFVDKYLHDHPEKLNLTDVILRISLVIAGRQGGGDFCKE